MALSERVPTDFFVNVSGKKAPRGRYSMRTNLLIAALILVALFAGFVTAQTKQVAPIPGDPLELATGPAIVADTPEKRSAILNLLERARQNNNWHVSGMKP